MAVTKIKKDKVKISVGILSAGVANRMKSYAPRSLLPIGETTLIEHQVKVLNNCFDNDLYIVIGHESSKIIKRIFHKIKAHYIENPLYEETQSSESLRLVVNNNISDNLLAIHGDIYYNIHTFKNITFNESFIIIDSNNQLPSKEVGVTINNDAASILSYDLPTKWAQIVYFAGKEYKLLQNLCHKENNKVKRQLLFEVINTIINRGGRFKCIEPNKMKIIEIDAIKDIYENFNS